jgi:hypothetical protein
MNVVVLAAADGRYPVHLQQRLGEESPKQIAMLGNPDILALPKTAFFCSARCPGAVILAAHDQAASWRDAGQCVIGGFHSPIEKECLKILLRGTQPIIICPARGIENMRTPRGWSGPITEGNLLVLSSFGGSQKRTTRDLAYRVVFAHVTPHGQLDRLKQQVTAWKIPIQNLLEA